MLVFVCVVSCLKCIGSFKRFTDVFCLLVSDCQLICFFFLQCNFSLYMHSIFTQNNYFIKAKTIWNSKKEKFTQNNSFSPKPNTSSSWDLPAISDSWHRWIQTQLSPSELGLWQDYNGPRSKEGKTTLVVFQSRENICYRLWKVFRIQILNVKIILVVFQSGKNICYRLSKVFRKIHIRILNVWSITNSLTNSVTPGIRH